MMSLGEWQSIEGESAADVPQALLRRGKVRLERGGEEYALVAEVDRGGDGYIKNVRVTLRRGGGAFLGADGSYPAVGAIMDSVNVTLSGPAVSLPSLSSGDRTRIAQAARQVMERVGSRIDSGD
jgi:hypothetical protein